MLDINDLIARITSHALTLGLFESVNGHEPKQAPGMGLTAAVWNQAIDPIPASGLASTSGRIEMNVRVYTNMIAEPQDAIDPNLMDAVVKLMAAYSGDFTLGSTIRYVDLIGGSSGVGLSSKAGYMNQDSRMFRVMTITLPLICNDIWDQEETD